MAASPLSHPVCQIPPVLSSASRDWKGILVEEMHLPPLDLPEHTLPEHLIRLHTGAPLMLHWGDEGRSRKTRLMPGDFCFVPAGVPRRIAWRDDATFLRVMLAPEILRQVAEQTGVGDCPLAEQYGFADGQMESLLLTLLAEARNGNLGGNLLAESLGVALFVQLLRRCIVSPQAAEGEADTLPDASRPALQEAADYLRDNLSANPALSDLAAIAGVSPAHFCTLFKRAMGMPPHRYLLNLRVDRAAHLLQRGDLSISQVATEVGFADQSHLTRHLKRLRGVTPGALLPPKRRS